MHNRFQNICPFYKGKKNTEVNHCNWMKKKSVQVAIIMTIFSKTYTVIKRNLNEKMLWTFAHVFTLSWWIFCCCL